MSCNGCRVLRKGCSDACVLRQCLRWIEHPDAQGHATVFVAKFFGRAGMMALISSVPESQRPALFQSLLYEACGRTVNPVFGAVGLLCSGNWKLCQDAVETVLRGELLCGSSTGTGRPGSSSSFHHLGGGAASGFKLPRSVRGSGAASSQGPLKIKPVKQEEEHEEDHAGIISKKRKASDHASMAMRPRAEMKKRGLQIRMSESGEKIDDACGDEGSPGLDLTLACSSSDYSSSPPDWKKLGQLGQLRDSAGDSLTAFDPVRCARRRRAPASRSSKNRSSSPGSCHSSEADSDTTELSISMIRQQQQQREYDQSFARSSAPMIDREPLLDLLH